MRILREPATDRCTALPNFEHSEFARGNDNWICLPALGRFKWIIADHEEGESVLGTEFSIESTRNPVARKTHEYSYSLLRKDQYQDRASWVIEMVATPDRTRRTNLENGVTWVDKALFRVLKDEYQRNGRIESGLQWIDDVAVMTRVEINNQMTPRISQLSKSPMCHSTEVEDTFPSQRTLTKFVFRERHVAGLRTAPKTADNVAGVQ